MLHLLAIQANHVPEHAVDFSTQMMFYQVFEFSSADMNPHELVEILARGEDSRHQFKADFTNADALAAELAALANGVGGQLFIGVNDDGGISGLVPRDIGDPPFICVCRPGRDHQPWSLAGYADAGTDSEGKSNRRNKVLAGHAAHILPYRGMGTGIPRALQAWPKIELIDDRDGNQFRAVVWRLAAEQVAVEMPKDSDTLQVPHKPRSSKQRYRLTERGRSALAEKNDETSSS